MVGMRRFFKTFVVSQLIARRQAAFKVEQHLNDDSRADSNDDE